MSAQQVSAAPQHALAEKPLVADVVVEPVLSRRQREDFIRLPWSLYTDDPNWVPPLLSEERRRIGPIEEFARSSSRRLWIARMNGVPVGRISAQLPDRGDPQTDPLRGRFGWLEAVDSAAVFQALLNAAESWLGDHGMAQCAGPFNFSINEECGVLVDGFDTPPMIMMPHSHRYYADRLAEAGYEKAVDMFAYKIDVRQPLPKRAERLRQRIDDDPTIVFRQLDNRKFDEEVGTVLRLFNDAWSGNWGFEPFTADHIADMAKALRPILLPPALCIAELNGTPAAFALGLPNINELIRKMNGRLLPFGWLELLYRIRFGRFSSGRLALMGVRKEFQSSPVGAALAVGVIDRLRQACLKHRVHTAELSWVLEDNRGVRSIIEGFGADRYKTYRIFTRAL